MTELIPNESTIGNISSFLEDDSEIKEEKNITIQGNNSYYKESFYTSDIYDEKEFTRFVKQTEKMIRRSNEYSAYIGHLRNEIDLSTCAFLNNVNDEMAEIEFHHYPFTLYDIVTIVIEDMLSKDEALSTFKVSKKVMELHFNNYIGLIPLSKTVHELTHAGQIFINLKQVYGNYYKFLDLYKDTINQFFIDDFNKLVDMSNNDTTYSDKDILKK